MHAMRKSAFSVLFFSIAVAPFFTLGCDLLKKGGDDAGIDVAAAPPTVAAVDAAVAPVDTTPPPTAAPLGGNTAVPVKPLADGGKPPVADAGVADAAKPVDGAAPAPTPTFPVIPGFDAGGLQIPNFDGGIPKPPWVK
jgi:hypothetical protein